MADPVKESQDLTNKVLNIRFALEKLNNQKQDLEASIKELQATELGLKKTNEEFLNANREFEKRLADLNIQIQAKKVELSEQVAKFQDEIDNKFKEIDETKAKQDKREKQQNDMDAELTNREVMVIEKQKNAESAVLLAEHMEKQNAVKEVELKNQANNLEQIKLVLDQEKQKIADKAWHQDAYERSLLEKETQVVAKLNTLSQRETQLSQLKNAIDNDRANFENDKNRNSYVLKVLQEIQTRCITNIGQKITEEIADKIRASVMDQMKPTEFIPNIVDKTILEPAPIQEPEAPEEVAEPVVEESTGEEPVQEPEENSTQEEAKPRPKRVIKRSFKPKK